MRTLIKTTTGTLSSQIILNHCGDYAGRFQDEAFEIFQELWDSELNSLDGNQWMDIMHDRNYNVFAVYAEDALTCQNAWCFYIQLDREDCPAAFAGMEEKMHVPILTKGKKVVVADDFFCKGFEGIIVSDGLTSSKYGDVVYTVLRTSDNTEFNVRPETVSAKN